MKCVIYVVCVGSYIYLFEGVDNHAFMGKYIYMI